MDDLSLQTLQLAFESSPSNLKLLSVLLREFEERGDAIAAQRLLDRADLTGLRDGSDVVAVARGYWNVGADEKALALLEGDSGEELLLRARILAKAGRREEAAAAYAKAVESNATLEDLDLKAAIGAKVRTLSAAKGPRLTVISNDDTDDTELTRLLEPSQEEVRFDDVGGLEDVKREIHRRIILPFKKPSIFQRFKKRVGGGILLYGPPGCGKTLLARATAGECKAQFFNVAIADVLDMYIGESERKLHAIFEKARSSAPSVLFFDELEALAAKRQYSREGVSSKLVSQFLSEMDGFSQNNAGVLILGATNVPWAVDSAFRRPGRFDRVLFVPPPDRTAREAILQALLKERPTEGDLGLGDLANRTSGYSGADLTQVVEAASDEAIEVALDTGREVPISREHLRKALKLAKPTTMEWLTTARNYAQYANESGHYNEVLDFLKKHAKG